MIIKRGSKPKPAKPGVPRMIVKRRTQVVGEQRPKAIIKRQRGVVQPPAGPPRGPRNWSWRPRKSLVVLASVAAAFVLLIAGMVWAWQSPMFRVSNIEVTGAGRTSTDTVVQKVNLLGESMFTADLSEAQRQIYELPLVAAVHIKREWPDTVKVVIEERRPWGTWEQGGVGYTIDREGVVLGAGAAANGAPVIKSSEPGSHEVGDRVDYQAVDAAAEIYEKLPRQLGTTVTEVAFVAGKGVQVTTADNQTALFGDSSSIAYKLAVWAAVAHEAQVEKINYTTIDLRYGNRPVLQ